MVAAAPAPGVFQRQPGLADAAQAAEGDAGGGAFLGLRRDAEQVGEPVKQAVAPDEQRAEAGLGQMHPSGDQPGGDEEIEQARAPHFGGQVIGVAEADAGEALHAGQPGEVGLLGGDLFGRRGVAGGAGGAGFGHGDDEVLAVVEGQPGFPLGVGQRWAVGFEEGRHRQLGGEIGVVGADRRDGGCLGHRAGHVADQVDNHVALADVLVEHVQRFGAGGDEILLHLDRDVGAVEGMTQGVAVAAELRADGG